MSWYEKTLICMKTRWSETFFAWRPDGLRHLHKQFNALRHFLHEDLMDWDIFLHEDLMNWDICTKTQWTETFFAWRLDGVRHFLYEDLMDWDICMKTQWTETFFCMKTRWTETFAQKIQWTETFFAWRPDEVRHLRVNGMRHLRVNGMRLGWDWDETGMGWDGMGWDEMDERGRSDGVWA